MERREAVIKISWMLKSAFLAPTILTVLQSCQDQVLNTRDLLVLNDEQDNLIVAIADTILPRTSSPSASDVKVDRFIDLLLQDVFDEEVKQNILLGLLEFDEDCESITGSRFVELNESRQYAYLEKVDKEIMEQEYDELVPFYYTFKHLVVTTYFSTEQGVKQNLNYMPIPGAYVGEVDLKPGDKIMIGNRM
jgi:hypothetical protein